MTRFNTLGFASILGISWLSASVAQGAVTLASGEPSDALDVAVLTNDVSQPTDVAELPDGRVVITERRGRVVVMSADGMTQTVAGNFTVDTSFGEEGLLGVVADPQFATNGMLYFFAVEGNDLANKHKVYKVPLGTDGMLASSRDTIISMGLLGSSFGNHNGGGLFIHNNLLYVSVGDSGNNATPPTNKLGTCLNSPNGKILRVDLNGDIPMDNPLVGETMVTGCASYNADLTMMAPDTRVFAWGFRNPYRFWIDPMTERLWVGDVGESTREEVSIGAPISAEGGNGQHFGWPFREGTTSYSQSWQPQGACMGVTPARECVPAVHDYATRENNNACVIGGLIPTGCGWEAPWTSRYIFGDNSSGRLWYLNVNSGRDGVMGGSSDFGSSTGVGSFRMGASGALYIVEVSGDQVNKITPKGLNPDMCGSGGMGGMGGMAGSAGASAGTAGQAQGGMSAGGASAGTSAMGGDAGMTTAGSGGGGGTPTGGAGGTTGGAMVGAGGTTGGAGGATGGAPTGGVGTGGSTGGTAPATGGTGGATAGGGAEEPGGCGCRVAGGSTSTGLFLASAAGLLFFGARRRRGRGLRARR
jgi:glucose/arabinose dehydrogenase